MGKHKYSDIADSELLWFWNYSESDMGIRSNYSAMISQSMSGGGKWYDHYTDAILESTFKNREITKALKKLTQHDQRVLYGKFGSFAITPEIKSKFGTLSGVVLAIAPSYQILRRASCINSQEAKDMCSALRIEAQKALYKAMKNYIAERKECWDDVI